MMLNRITTTSLLFFICLNAHAFPCYITAVKDNCWTDYDVKIDAINVMSEEKLATIEIPKGTSWTRIPLDCQLKETVMFKTTFSPILWEEDQNKVYYAKRYWSFPDTINKNDKVWNMTICYTQDFSALPLPPEASGHCSCNTSVLPPVTVPK